MPAECQTPALTIATNAATRGYRGLIGLLLGNCREEVRAREAELTALGLD